MYITFDLTAGHPTVLNNLYFTLFPTPWRPVPVNRSTCSYNVHIFQKSRFWSELRSVGVMQFIITPHYFWSDRLNAPAFREWHWRFKCNNKALVCFWLIDLFSYPIPWTIICRLSQTGPGWFSDKIKGICACSPPTNPSGSFVLKPAHSTCTYSTKPPISFTSSPKRHHV